MIKLSQIIGKPVNVKAYRADDGYSLLEAKTWHVVEGLSSVSAVLDIIQTIECMCTMHGNIHKVIVMIETDNKSFINIEEIDLNS